MKECVFTKVKRMNELMPQAEIDYTRIMVDDRNEDAVKTKYQDRIFIFMTPHSFLSMSDAAAATLLWKMINDAMGCGRDVPETVQTAA